MGASADLRDFELTKKPERRKEKEKARVTSPPLFVSIYREGRRRSDSFFFLHGREYLLLHPSLFIKD